MILLALEAKATVRLANQAKTGCFGLWQVWQVMSVAKLGLVQRKWTRV
jgi:hypothetical protein